MPPFGLVLNDGARETLDVANAYRTSPRDLSRGETERVANSRIQPVQPIYCALVMLNRLSHHAAFALIWAVVMPLCCCTASFFLPGDSSLGGRMHSCCQAGEVQSASSPRECGDIDHQQITKRGTHAGHHQHVGCSLDDSAHQYSHRTTQESRPVHSCRCNQRPAKALIFCKLVPPRVSSLVLCVLSLSLPEVAASEWRVAADRLLASTPLVASQSLLRLHCAHNE